MRAVLQRVRFVRKIVSRRFIALLVAIYAAVGVPLFVRDEFLPAEWQERLRLGPLSLTLSPWQWATVGIALLALVLLESAFREANEASELAPSSQTDPVLEFERSECSAEQVYKNHGIYYVHPSDGPTDLASGIADWVSVVLLRITLTNTQPNSVAKNVRVMVTACEPPLRLLPADLHEKHNNQPPYRTRRDIRHDEPIIFDVVARDLDYGSDQLYLFRSDLGDEYVYPLSDKDLQKLIPAIRDKGIILQISVFADPPARLPVPSSFRLTVNSSGFLVIEQMSGQVWSRVS